jgi:hypothetical protein
MEFMSVPEKGEELPLEEFGSALGVGNPGMLGKYTSGLVSCMVGAKMPGGFNSSAIKSYLSKSWGLGPLRADGVLLLGTTLKPPSDLHLSGGESVAGRRCCNLCKTRRYHFIDWKYWQCRWGRCRCDDQQRGVFEVPGRARAVRDAIH